MSEHTTPDPAMSDHTIPDHTIPDVTSSKHDLSDLDLTTPDALAHTQTLPLASAPEPPQGFSPAADRPSATSEPMTPPLTWIEGPAVGPIVIGVIGLLAMVGAWLAVATSLTINWSIAGPAAVIGVGAVIVSLGLLGLRRSRS